MEICPSFKIYVALCVPRFFYDSAFLMRSSAFVRFSIEVAKDKRM